MFDRGDFLVDGICLEVLPKDTDLLSEMGRVLFYDFSCSVSHLQRVDVTTHPEGAMVRVLREILIKLNLGAIDLDHWFTTNRNVLHNFQGLKWK